jgi:hypothetical protein
MNFVLTFILLLSWFRVSWSLYSCGSASLDPVEVPTGKWHSLVRNRLFIEMTQCISPLSMLNFFVKDLQTHLQYLSKKALPITCVFFGGLQRPQIVTILSLATSPEHQVYLITTLSR